MSTKITSPSAIASGGDYDASPVVVSGVACKGYQNEQAALQLAGLSNVKIDGIKIIGNIGTGAAILNSHGVTLTNFTVDGNAGNGLGGVNSSNVLLQDGVISNSNRGVVNPPWAGASGTELYNGKWYLDPRNEGGGGKYFNCDNWTITRVLFAGNGGVDSWPDSQCTNFTYNQCWFNGAVDPDGAGPIPSWTAIGEGVENDLGPMTFNQCYWDRTSRLAIQESQNVTVNGGWFDGSGIEFRASTAHSTNLQAVTISGASFVNGASVGFSVGNAGNRNILFRGCVADTQAAVDTINAISPGGCKLVPTSSITIPTTPPGAFSSPPTGGGTIPPPVISPLPESADGSYVGAITPPGAVKVGTVSDGTHGYTITSGAQVKVDGLTDSVTKSVVGLLYYAKQVYQVTTSGVWYVLLQAHWSQIPSDPRPSPSPSPSTDSGLTAQLAKAQADLLTEKNLVVMLQTSLAQVGKYADQIKAITG